jgi:hypothetical protein
MLELVTSLAAIARAREGLWRRAVAGYLYCHNHRYIHASVQRYFVAILYNKAPVVLSVPTSAIPA